jgi:hypothetical protein
LPETPASGETLARFAWDEDHVRAGDVPTWKLFRPNRNKTRGDGRLEVSLNRIEGQSSREIWSDGRAIWGEKLLGRADIIAAVVSDPAIGLLLDTDPAPSRHTAIVGWPEGDDLLTKGDRKTRMQALADKASYIGVDR